MYKKKISLTAFLVFLCGITATICMPVFSAQAESEKVLVFSGTIVPGGGNHDDVWSSEGNLTSWKKISEGVAPTLPTTLYTGIPTNWVTYFNGKLFAVGGATQVAGATVEKRDGVWVSSDEGVTWTNLVPEAPWPIASLLVSEPFNNKLWVIGSRDGGIWSSPDGSTWTKVTSTAPFTQGMNRYRSLNVSALVFQNKLWVISGGHYGGGFVDSFTNASVWSSDDGITWTEVTSGSAIPWVPRAWFSSTVFNGRMWIIGGLLKNSTQYADGKIHGLSTISVDSYSDVWSSADGKNWIPSSVAPEFGNTIQGSLIVYKNKMWMLPKDERNNSGSVWYSSDGAVWTKATSGQKWKIQNAVVIPGNTSTTPSVSQDTQSVSLPALMLSKNLQLGQANSEILTLQTYLVSQAYLNAVPNGRYGPLTRQAVQKLQSDLGIESDGSSVGPKTRALLSNPPQKIISSETAASGAAAIAKLSVPCTNPSINISRTQDASGSQGPIAAGANTLVAATYVVTAGGANCLIRLTNIKYEVTGDPAPITVSSGPDWPLRFPWLYSMPMKRGNAVLGTASTFFARVTPSGSGSAYIAPVQIDAVTQDGIPVTAVTGLNVKSKALIVAE